MTSTNHSTSSAQAPGFTESDFEDLDLELDDLDDLGNFKETGEDDRGNEGVQEEDDDFSELNEEDDSENDIDGVFLIPPETDSEVKRNQTDSNEDEEEEFEEPLLDKRRHKTQVRLDFLLFVLFFSSPNLLFLFFSQGSGSTMKASKSDIFDDDDDFY